MEQILMPSHPEIPSRPQNSFFGKLPYEQEIETGKEIISDIEDVYSRTFLPFILFDREIVKEKLMNVKNKLEMLV